MNLGMKLIRTRIDPTPSSEPSPTAINNKEKKRPVNQVAQPHSSLTLTLPHITEWAYFQRPNVPTHATPAFLSLASHLYLRLGWPVAQFEPIRTRQQPQAASTPIVFTWACHATQLAAAPSDSSPLLFLFSTCLIVNVVKCN